MRNVFEEALDRVRLVYKMDREPVVSMSGGKDSTVLYEITHMVAKELGRLPVKVLWLDQEAEWQGTVDYMSEVMHRPEVEPYWYQFPFDFTNAMSFTKNFIRLWDPKEEKNFVHPYADISIKDNPTGECRFYPIVARIPKCCGDNHGRKVASFVGLRVQESRARRLIISHAGPKPDGITWSTWEVDKYAQAFYPIYDWRFDDVWTAIAKNNWKYNRVYDLMYQHRVPKKNMRVSSLIHEISAPLSVKMLHEFEPATYNRFINRVYGTSTFSHFGNDLKKMELPFAFKSWREYRDYLLLNLVQERYWELFIRRWWNQNDEDWYHTHIWEITCNDIDGTFNANHKLAMKCKDKDNKDRYVNRMNKEMYERRAEDAVTKQS